MITLKNPLKLLSMSWVPFFCFFFQFICIPAFPSRFVNKSPKHLQSHLFPNHLHALSFYFGRSLRQPLCCLIFSYFLILT